MENSENGRRQEKTTKILIEPVISSKNVNKYMGKIGIKRRIAEHLITESSMHSEFYLQIHHIEGELPEKIKIKNIRIINKQIGFEQTFPPDRSISFNGNRDVIYNEPFYMVFPLPGIYWLELEIEPIPETIRVETKQRRLDNGLGPGWSEHVKAKDNYPKLNFLRQPILVLESNVIYQIKLNRSLIRLTWAIVFLTLAIIILNVIL